jgi:hypothetical protein
MGFMSKVGDVIEFHKATCILEQIEGVLTPSICCEYNHTIPTINVDNLQYKKYKFYNTNGSIVSNNIGLIILRNQYLQSIQNGSCRFYNGENQINLLNYKVKITHIQEHNLTKKHEKSIFCTRINVVCDDIEHRFVLSEGQLADYPIISNIFDFSIVSL